MGKALQWRTFPKCRARWLSPHFLNPLFWKCPHLGTSPYTIPIAPSINDGCALVHPISLTQDQGNSRECPAITPIEPLSIFSTFEV